MSCSMCSGTNEFDIADALRVAVELLIDQGVPDDDASFAYCKKVLTSRYCTELLKKLARTGL